MHEMSLAEGVLQLVEEASTRDGFKRVKTIFLEIGRLSSVEPDAMRFCFEAVTRNTLAAGAELQIIDVPGLGHCLGCGTRFALESRYDACSACGSFRITPVAGTEMRVRELEVE